MDFFNPNELDNYLKEVENHTPDYNTNAESYYKALAKHKYFMKLFTAKIIQLNNTLQEEFKDQKDFTQEKIDDFQNRLDGIKQEMTDFFNQWLADGVLDEVINQDILNAKADKIDVDQRGLNLLNYESFKLLARDGYDWKPAIEKALEDIQLNPSIKTSTLIIPSGIYDYYGFINFKDVTVRGESGTILNARMDDQALILDDNTELYNITTTNNFSTIRGASNNHHAIWVKGENITIDKIFIAGSKAGGIYYGGAENVHTSRCVVSDTFADGYHITSSSKKIFIDSCIGINNGDDTFAVVSYQDQTTPCEDIFFSNIYSLFSKSRGFSVVGGKRVSGNNLKIMSPKNAGVLIAYEGSYGTFGCEDITLDMVRVYNANTHDNPTTNYGALHINSNNSLFPIDRVTINDFIAFDSRWRGVVIGSAVGDGSAPNKNITITNSKLIRNKTDSEGFYYRNCDNLSVIDLEVEDFGRTGIYDDTSNKGIIEFIRPVVKNVNRLSNLVINGITVRSNPTLLRIKDAVIIDTLQNLARSISITSATRWIEEGTISIGNTLSVNKPDPRQMIPVYIGQIVEWFGVVYVAKGTTAITDWVNISA